jgi:hypothetical protein
MGSKVITIYKILNGQWVNGKTSMSCLAGPFEWAPFCFGVFFPFFVSSPHFRVSSLLGRTKRDPQPSCISRAFFSMQYFKNLHVAGVAYDIETYCLYHPLIDIVLRFNI